MNKLILIISLLFLATQGNEHPLPSLSMPLEIVTKQTTAQFLPAYDLLRSWEQNYANHPLDRGKETYAGISRRNYPKWYGWEYIDEWKKVNRTQPKWNQEFPGVVQFYVYDFYLDIWFNEGFDKLEDQDIANVMFDIRINSPRFINTIQYILIRYGYEVEVDGRLGPETVEAINLIKDKEQLLEDIKQNRGIYYINIVKRYPSQKVFLGEWLRRSHYGGIINRENV